MGHEDLQSSDRSQAFFQAFDFSRRGSQEREEPREDQKVYQIPDRHRLAPARQKAARLRWRPKFAVCTLLFCCLLPPSSRCQSNTKPYPPTVIKGITWREPPWLYSNSCPALSMISKEIPGTPSDRLGCRCSARTKEVLGDFEHIVIFVERSDVLFAVATLISRARNSLKLRDLDVRPSRLRRQRQTIPSIKVVCRLSFSAESLDPRLGRWTRIVISLTLGDGTTWMSPRASPTIIKLYTGTTCTDRTEHRLSRLTIDAI